VFVPDFSNAQVIALPPPLHHNRIDSHHRFKKRQCRGLRDATVLQVGQIQQSCRHTSRRRSDFQEALDDNSKGNAEISVAAPGNDFFHQPPSFAPDR